jgi:hypothetical protein
MAGSMIGVPTENPAPDGALMIAPGGHTSMQSLHRVHAARNANSSNAPGGRKYTLGATRRSARRAAS